jgi:predicted nuclease with TOPRIM domain
MTNEEIQERIEFLIEQQSQLTASVDRFAAKVDTLVEIQANSETRLSRVEESFVLLVQMARITDERLDVLTDRVSDLTDRVSDLTEKMGALAEAEKNSDERLNTLIGVVERHISEEHNGKSRG